MTAVLRQFAADVGVGPKKRVVIVIDGAGWHKAKDLEVPVGIYLVFLPPYSPELQPAERLWPLINEVVANRTFMTLAKLIETVSQRCVFLEQNPGLVSALTRYRARCPKAGQAALLAPLAVGRQRQLASTVRSSSPHRPLFANARR